MYNSVVLSTFPTLCITTRSVPKFFIIPNTLDQSLCPLLVLVFLHKFLLPDTMIFISVFILFTARPLRLEWKLRRWQGLGLCCLLLSHQPFKSDRDIVGAQEMVVDKCTDEGRSCRKREFRKRLTLCTVRASLSSPHLSTPPSSSSHTDFAVPCSVSLPSLCPSCSPRWKECFFFMY